MVIEPTLFEGLITLALLVTSMTPLVLIILLVKDWLGGNLW